MAPAFAELHCVSNFTFLRGASHADELAERAAKLGYVALAITDECSLAGIVRAHEGAKKHGLPLIVGSEIRLADGPKLVLLAQDREGYGNLSALITKGRRRSEKGEYHLVRDDLNDGLPGCLAIVIPPLALTDGEPALSLIEQAQWLAARFRDRLWIAVELHHAANDEERLPQLQALSAVTGAPLVASNDVHMHSRGRRALQDVLTAIRLRVPVARAGHGLFPNGERHLRSRDKLAQLYPPELLAESVAIAARCTFSLDSLRYEYPEEIVPAGETPASWLRKLTTIGLQWRFCGGAPPWEPVTDQDRTAASPPPGVVATVERELALIADLGYEPYFLTVYDIVAFARRQGILCQGRGSAANSAVCFALGITEVDPARMSMLFERFISKERNEPPDIDVDFEHQRREEVIQYIYSRYGRERAAIAATVICYRSRSAFRDAGRALGLDVTQVDRISKNLAFWDRGQAVPERLREAGFDPDSRLMQRLLRVAEALRGFPRHLSQHVGGFVVSRGPIDRLVPVENAAMPERTIIQWDKDDLDALGLLKVDVLALGMLSAIRRALDLIGHWRGAPLRMQDIPAEDPEVYAMLQKADSIGVFQVESRAQMTMLPRLKPAKFYDLVVEVAIVRPGPIQGGMVHPYLRRRRGQEPVTYPSPEVKAVLERTLGIPIFQEQVMQLAMVAAGFTAGEADQLRRAMAAWRRKGGLEPFERRLVDGMLSRGYSEQFAQQIFQQILGFGEYGFPESHAASFSLLVYVSAWLKRHHPASFCAALLNSQPMGFYAPSQLIQDAQRHGVQVLPVDAMASAWDCSLEVSPRGADDTPSPPAMRLGLRMVSGLSQAAAERLIAERERPFDTFEQLALRAQLNRHDFGCLATADALASVIGHRREALWEVAGIEPRPPVLHDTPIREQLPLLPEPSEGETIVADYASLGLTLGRHPLALLRGQLQRQRMMTASQLLTARHGQLVRAAGLVTCRQRPSTASGVIFVTLEDETGNANVVVWRDLGERQRRTLLGARLLGVHGVLERDGDVAHLIAGKLVDLSHLLGRLLTHSRDFH